MKKNIGLGGSCHWCTEAIFASLTGVQEVKQGWLASTPPNNSFSEGVLLSYDDEKITMQDLISIHLHTHSATAKHFLRDKYRSAVYVDTQQELSAAAQAITAQQTDFDKPLITQALIFKQFRGNQEKFINYYYKDPERPFCQAYINPKLKVLLEKYAKHIDAEKNTIIQQSIKTN